MFPVVSRRPRGAAGALANLRASVGDAALVGIWWGRSGVTAASGVASDVVDARGTGFGPTLSATGTGKPAYSSTTGLITFDGSDDFLKAVGGNLANITDECWMAFIGTLGAATGVEQRLVELGSAAGGGSQVLVLLEAATTGNLSAGANASVSVNASPAAASNYPGTRVFQGRRSNLGGGNIRVGVQIGVAAEVTADGAAAALAGGQLVVGANRGGSANFAGCTMAAVVLGTGASTAAIRQAVVQFGQSLGAV